MKYQKLLKQNGDLEEAEKYFRESLKQEDLESGSYYYLSQIALLKGDEEKATNYMNVAVQLDEKSYKLMQKDPLFTPIKQEVIPPPKVQEEYHKEEEKVTTKKTKKSQKEKKVDKHLTKMCILVENLSSDDIKIIRNQKEKQIEKEEKQKE